MQMLTGKVALVTGSTRGVGRGIAVCLGEAGATVFVTGRSSGGQRTENLPGTVEDAATEIDERGGRGIPVRCDFRDDVSVASLFDRIRADAGKLDILVNNVWGGYEQQPSGLSHDPFWKLSPEYWDRMFTGGLRAHLQASRLAVPLMLPARRGLIVNTIAWAGGKYLIHLYYDLAKQSIVRMSYGMSLELRKHGIASVALAPGFVRSERVMAAHAAHPFDLSATESPEYIGRAVVALASDPKVMEKSGQVLTAGDLAVEYGFTDIDGRRIPPFRMPEGMLLD
jgi:NAD(P)-dependent dehydrogenase (short-subunit alcohol dehydrogenase family)